MLTPLDRACIALKGLSVGDAFGQCFFAMDPAEVDERISRREAPSPPWWHTDDTEMAIGVVEVLARHGRIEQDDLARVFADRFAADPHRIYGGGTIRILTAVAAGADWRIEAASCFGGGSLGNGSAMRVAPLGAYFSDNVPQLIEQARRSAAVTHAHSEGGAGAIAVALAAAFAWNYRDDVSPDVGGELLRFVHDLTPHGATRDGIARAIALSPLADARNAAVTLGNGERITCPDTVPFCLWVAARHFRDYVGAMWATVGAGGDMDTNCAIVGGIIAGSAPVGSMPAEWVAARGAIKLNI